MTFSGKQDCFLIVPLFCCVNFFPSHLLLSSVCQLPFTLSGHNVRSVQFLYLNPHWLWSQGLLLLVVKQKQMHGGWWKFANAYQQIQSMFHFPLGGCWSIFHSNKVTGKKTKQKKKSVIKWWLKIQSCSLMWSGSIIWQFTISWAALTDERRKWFYLFMNRNVCVYKVCVSLVQRESEHLEFNGVFVQPTEHTYKQYHFELLFYTVTSLAGLQMYFMMTSTPFVSPL